jgi:hypothetical protein
MEAKYGEGAYAKQDNRFKVQEPLIDVQALVELGASFGPVAINAPTATGNTSADTAMPCCRAPSN